MARLLLAEQGESTHSQQEGSAGMVAGWHQRPQGMQGGCLQSFTFACYGHSYHVTEPAGACSLHHLFRPSSSGPVKYASAEQRHAVFMPCWHLPMGTKVRGGGGNPFFW